MVSGAETCSSSIPAMNCILLNVCVSCINCALGLLGLMKVPSVV